MQERFVTKLFNLPIPINIAGEIMRIQIKDQGWLISSSNTNLLIDHFEGMFKIGVDKIRNLGNSEVKIKIRLVRKVTTDIMEL